LTARQRPVRAIEHNPGMLDADLRQPLSASLAPAYSTCAPTCCAATEA
jgi:hypothetical protein